MQTPTASLRPQRRRAAIRRTAAIQPSASGECEIATSSTETKTATVNGRAWQMLLASHPSSEAIQLKMQRFKMRVDGLTWRTTSVGPYNSASL